MLLGGNVVVVRCTSINAKGDCAAMMHSTIFTVQYYSEL